MMSALPNHQLFSHSTDDLTGISCSAPFTLKLCNEWLSDKPEDWVHSLAWLDIGLQTPEAAMSHRTGLPISPRYNNVSFLARSILCLRKDQMLNDDVMDLFSILDCGLHENVEYIPTGLFAVFRNQYFYREGRRCDCSGRVNAFQCNA